MSFTKEKLEKLAIINIKLNLEKNETFIRSKNIIFIYTPPKVGSTCLVSSIRLFAAEKFTILHIHDELMLNLITDMNDITILDIIKYNKYIGKNVYVIDIYRTPIERKLSDYFEKLSDYHFNNTEENVSQYNIERIIRRFNKIFSHIGNGDYYIDKYEILKLHSFDFEKKYLIQENDGIKYIKLRLMDSNEWSNILTNILETEIKVIKDYETKEKIIGKLYEKVKIQYKIPKNYLEDIKSSEYLHYYLTDEERKSYISKWEEKTTINVIGYTDNEFKLYEELCAENKHLNDIQMEHYIDMGCICKPCSIKRYEYRDRIRNGIEVKDKILHNTSCNEYNTKIGYIVGEINKKNNKKSITKKEINKGYMNKLISISMKPDKMYL